MSRLPPHSQYENSLPSELLWTSRALAHDDKNFFPKFNFIEQEMFGLITTKDAMLPTKRKLMAFTIVRSKPKLLSCKEVWEKIQRLVLLQYPIQSPLCKVRKEVWNKEVETSSLTGVSGVGIPYLESVGAVRKAQGS